MAKLSEKNRKKAIEMVRVEIEKNFKISPSVLTEKVCKKLKLGEGEQTFETITKIVSNQKSRLKASSGKTDKKEAKTAGETRGKRGPYKKREKTGKRKYVRKDTKVTHEGRPVLEVIAEINTLLMELDDNVYGVTVQRGRGQHTVVIEEMDRVAS